MDSVFKKLAAIDVSAYTEKKNGLTYLSWAQAWREFKSQCPEATYSIAKGAEGRPYIEDENLGYMVMTTVTVGDESHSMWLPVLDFRNKAIPVGQATMFDVNTALMRCLTKNLAMFGLGVYIYAGEDLPIEAAKSAEDCLKTLADCNVIEDLAAAWKALPAAFKKRQDFIALKEAKKTELS